MSAVADRILVRLTEPQTLDRAAASAVDGSGSVVGRAMLSRLYGLRAEIELDLATSDAVAIALIDALEREARRRRLVRLELASRSVSRSVATAVRHSRHASEERRRDLPYLTWSTTSMSS